MREMGNWHEYLMESLADPEKAMSYLNVSLEEYQADGDTAFFLVGLRNVVEAYGGISILAERTGIDSKDLLKVLSNGTAPRLDTFINILAALGFRLSIAPITPKDLNIEDANIEKPVAGLDHSEPDIKVATTDHL